MVYAVIFDVDGVLVDSFEAHLRSWQSLADQTGVRFTTEQFAGSFGRTSREIIAMHWYSLNLSVDLVRELDQRKEVLYRSIVAERFPAMDGAAYPVNSLHEVGFRLAVGSSGPAENVVLALDRLGVLGCFAAIVTGEEVSRGKPDPEVFLKAVRRLGIDPARCAVIEDAPAGIAATRAAGMASVAFLSRGRARPDFQPTPPDCFIESLGELSDQRLRELIDARTVT